MQLYERWSFHSASEEQIYTSSYASRTAACSRLSPTSFRPFGRNHSRLGSSSTTTTWCVDGWKMTMPAPAFRNETMRSGEVAHMYTEHEVARVEKAVRHGRGGEFG
jgi:hypothetical protein